MQGAIRANDLLEHLSVRQAQDCAIRLCTACSAVTPSDKKLQDLVAEKIIADVLDLAFHGRRSLEFLELQDACLGSGALWPASSIDAPAKKLKDLFGLIVHSKSLEVVWEKVDLSPNPYDGRTPVFAGHVIAQSDRGEDKLPLGAIVTTYVRSVLNRADRQPV